MALSNVKAAQLQSSQVAGKWEPVKFSGYKNFKGMH